MPLPSLMVRPRLLLIGLHLFSAVIQVALLFPFCRVPWRLRLRRIWSRQLLTLLGIRVEPVGDPLTRIDGGLLVGNHISFIDIYVINALFPCGFVAKREVASWPLVGWLSRHNDTVFMERGNLKAAHRTHRRVLEALAAGRSVAIFPEGTTTAGDTLRPFHPALFQSAIDAAVPVHAIAISYCDANGAPSRAPAYIDDMSLIDCMASTLNAGGLVARVTLARTFSPPLAQRRDVARHAHQAIATALAAGSEFVRAPSLTESDPTNKAGNLSNNAAQPLRNQVAISP